MTRTIMLAAVLGLGATACATTAGEPPVAGAGSCGAEAAQELVGRQATQELAAEAMRLTGAETLRWIPEGSAVTMDYRPGRLNIEYDAGMSVTTIRCG